MLRCRIVIAYVNVNPWLPNWSTPPRPISLPPFLGRSRQVCRLRTGMPVIGSGWRNERDTRHSRASGRAMPETPPWRQIGEPARAIRAHRVREPAHQQPKEESGYATREGRSWQGPHRDALIPMIAFAFLQSLRLSRPKKGGWDSGPPPKPIRQNQRSLSRFRPIASLKPWIPFAQQIRAIKPGRQERGGGFCRLIPAIRAIPVIRAIPARCGQLTGQS